MRDLTNRALDTAAHLGAEYADARVVRRMDESIAIKSGRVEGVAAGESEGFGVRVLVDGAWGFASSNRLTTAEADRIAGQAVRIAKASATALRDRVRLDDRPPAHGTYETPVDEDPFEVPLEQKIQLLLAADAAANRAKGVTFSETRYDARREWKTFAATDGSFTEQTITHVGAGVEANAIEGDEHQRRSYPDGDGGPFKAAGFEYVRGLDLETRAEAIGEEAVELLSAPQCPSGRFTIVLDPSQLYMQVHESCGHPSELDRVLRHGGELRGHELPDDRQARRGLPLRQRRRRHRRRRHRARRHGHVRLGRRGRRGGVGADRPERHLRRLPLVARDRAADRPPVGWRDAGRRLEPDPAHPDDEPEPPAEAGHEPRRHRRRHRRRASTSPRTGRGRSTTAA